MKKRWISLFVENEIGVLARISGLFSSKAYNEDSLSGGESEDPTVSRMNICLTSDDKTFEQIKKQLNRSVEVIKVVDITELAVHMKEILFVKVNHCTEKEKDEVFRIAQVFRFDVIDYNKNTILLQCVQSADKNDDIIRLLNRMFVNRIEVVRGGNVAIESISMNDR